MHPNTVNFSCYWDEEKGNYEVELEQDDHLQGRASLREALLSIHEGAEKAQCHRQQVANNLSKHISAS